MKRSWTIGICAGSMLILGGAGFLDANQPLEEHPPAGHPAVPTPREDWPQAKPEDVASVDSIIKAMYASTGGEAKAPRDWDRFRSLFLPDARMVACRPRADGGCGAMFLSVDDFVAQNRKYLEKGGFADSELARRTESFGNVTQAWSTYQTIQNKNTTPYARGVNSIQLLRDGKRWWIVNVFWDFERADNPIPEKYLTSDTK